MEEKKRVKALETRHVRQTSVAPRGGKKCRNDGGGGRPFQSQSQREVGNFGKKTEVWKKGI